MTAAASTANAYLRTRVMTASREELRLLLLEGAIKFARQAREGLIGRNFEQVFSGTDNARNILMELITTIRSEPNPELADQVRALYTYMYVRLTEASFDKNLAKFDEVLKLLDYERETWIMLMDKLAAERGDAPAEPAEEAPAPARRGPLSIEG
jgi:flagellar protein FliS